MDNRVMQQAFDALAERRALNAREETRRLKEIRTRFPELAQLVDTRHRAVMDAVRAAFTSPAGEDLPRKMAEWNAAIRAGLSAQGLPENYLEPIDTCPVCHDTGYAGEGKKTLCACVRALYARLLAGEADFEAEQTFERYDRSVFPDTPLPGGEVTQRRYMDVIRRRCEAYAEALPTPAQPTLLFYGGSGLGKTYLLRCIHHRALQRGVPSLCLTANRLLNLLRDAYFSREQDAHGELYENELLLIDDLGAEPLLENITVEQLFNLLNERQNARLCTVLSTNLTLNELKARYTERFLSRLSDRGVCQLLQFLGSDIRQLPKA